jgi:hypothetical protein
LDINVLGYSIVVVSLVGLVVYFYLVFLSPWAYLVIRLSAFLYFYLVFLSPWAYLVIRLSAFLAVAVVVVVVAWVKCTFTSAPSEDLGLEELVEGEE